MTRIEPRYVSALPPHAARIEWRNTSDGWLWLELPGAAEPIEIAPNCKVQITTADLARFRWIEKCIEDLEREGRLMRTQ